jgi:hypothetical protein
MRSVVDRNVVMRRIPVVSRTARYNHGPTNSTATMPLLTLDPGKQCRCNLEPGLTARSIEALFRISNSNEHVAMLDLLYTGKNGSNVSFSLLFRI